jgi:hypothetical protein
MTTQRLGAGTIGIARALKARFPRMNLSDVAAQQALVTRKLRISGRNQDISKDVAEAIATTGQDLIGRMLPILQQQSRYVLTTGGGTVLLHESLIERTAKIGKRPGSDYAIINHGRSSVLNAVGALFAVRFAAAKRATPWAGRRPPGAGGYQTCQRSLAPVPRGAQRGGPDGNRTRRRVAGACRRRSAARSPWPLRRLRRGRPNRSTPHAAAAGDRVSERAWGAPRHCLCDARAKRQRLTHCQRKRFCAG